jgi:rhamnose transport system permease protein
MCSRCFTYWPNKKCFPAVDISQFWQLAISGAIILIAIIINTKTEQRKDKTIMVE